MDGWIENGWMESHLSDHLQQLFHIIYSSLLPDVSSVFFHLSSGIVASLSNFDAVSHLGEF